MQTSTVARTFGAFALTLIIGLALAIGPVHANEADRKAIDAAADAALQKLLAKDDRASQLMEKATGYLVFPEIKKAALGVGGEGGKGVLRSQGESIGYYRTRAISVGLQAGAQTYSTVILFMTADSYQAFVAKDKGYELGVSGSVAVIDTGASGKVDTATAEADIVAFVFNEAGLMADLSIEGSKISKLDI